MMSLNMNSLKMTLIGVILLSAPALTGCANNAQSGALIGGASGAGLGAIIGNQSRGRSGEGALIGAAVGTLGGYIVGNEMDKDQQRYRDYDRYAPPPPHYDYAPAPRYERYDSYGSGGYYERSYRRHEEYGPGYRRTYERYEYER